MNLRTLDASQTRAFDTEYVHDGRWSMFAENVLSSFPDGKFRFLDVGGGNGLFCDRVLKAWPKAEAVLLDCSSGLLARNAPQERKRLIEASVADLGRHATKEFDLICFNWLLHHMVSDSYRASRAAIWSTIKTGSQFLRQPGFVSIFENMYDGWIFDRVPSRLIYALTSNRALAPVMSKMGANTAGVGVCFLSKAMWEETIGNAGLRILKYTDDFPWKLSPLRKLLLHLGRTRVGHFWCAA